MNEAPLNGPHPMPNRHRALALGVALAAIAAGSPALAASSPSLSCPKVGSSPRVYAIGSSTMGSTLAPILRAELKALGARFRSWGKASSGLARPDFHDWPAVLPGSLERHRPDFVVVSLGTNDGQALAYREGSRLKWAKIGTELWRREYGARVDRVLAIAAGDDRSRPVIWLGPTGHPSKRYNKRMVALRDVIRERVRAFGGPAVFVDGLEQTLDAKTGKPVQWVSVPGIERKQGALQPDGLHLTAAGARWLLAEPVLELLRPCLGAAHEAAGQ